MKKKLLAVLLVVITVVPVFAGNGRFFLSLGPAGNYNSWKIKKYKQNGGEFVPVEDADPEKFGGAGIDFSAVIQPNKDSVFSIFIDDYFGFPIGRKFYTYDEKSKFTIQDSLAFGPAVTFGRNGDFLNGTLGIGPSMGFISSSLLWGDRDRYLMTDKKFSLGVAAFGQLMFNINDMFYIDLVAVPSIRFIQWGRYMAYKGEKRSSGILSGYDITYTWKGFEFDVKAKVGFGVKLGNKDM